MLGRFLSRRQPMAVPSHPLEVVLITHALSRNAGYMSQSGMSLGVAMRQYCLVLVAAETNSRRRRVMRTGVSLL
jgi:hypothetical protein